MKKNDQTCFFSGLPLASSDIDTLLTTWGDHLDHSRSTAYIFTPNPEQVLLARREPRFAAVLQQADWLIPDGIGLVWATQWLYRQVGQVGLSQRVSGRVVAERLIKLASERSVPVLIIGGRGYAGRRIGQFLVEEVTGQTKPDSTGFHLWWTPAYQQVQSPSPAEEQHLRAVLNQTKPAIVLVAFGAPWQEYWSMNHRAELSAAGVGLVLVVGGAIDVLTGQLAAPPSWVARLGLEWLFRLGLQPWRWRRQLAIPQFIKLVVTAGTSLIKPQDQS